MALELRPFCKKDYKQALRFAVVGMHFQNYTDQPLALQLYGRYFLYTELSRATEVLAAYENGRLSGVLMASFTGAPTPYRSVWKTLYIKAFDILQRLFAKKGVSAYEAANQALYAAYRQRRQPDGEITFLAADPLCQRQGVGSFLLKALARRHPGRTVYLYTDDACTYMFYERRGFERAGETRITMQLGRKTVPLRCFLYSKTL